MIYLNKKHLLYWLKITLEYLIHQTVQAPSHHVIKGKTYNRGTTMEPEPLSNCNTNIHSEPDYIINIITYYIQTHTLVLQKCRIRYKNYKKTKQRETDNQ